MCAFLKILDNLTCMCVLLKCNTAYCPFWISKFSMTKLHVEIHHFLSYSALGLVNSGWYGGFCSLFCKLGLLMGFSLSLF